jgi:hypothetical protein
MTSQAKSSIEWRMRSWGSPPKFIQHSLERQDRGRQPDAHAPGAGGGHRGQGGGIHGQTVVDEVMLGQPDLVEAELLRPLHLLELAVHDVFVAEPRHRLEEKERAEAH